MAIGSFILADYELLSISYRLYSIQDYISFYNATTQQYLLSSYNILVSLNVIMFVVYCVNIINQQQGNLDEIHALNEQLQDVNEQLQEYSVMAEKMAETRERNRLAMGNPRYPGAYPDRNCCGNRRLPGYHRHVAPADKGPAGAYFQGHKGRY